MTRLLVKNCHLFFFFSANSVERSSSNQDFLGYQWKLKKQDSLLTKFVYFCNKTEREECGLNVYGVVPASALRFLQ